MASGVSADDIVVLSKYRKENSNLSKINNLCNLTVIEQTGIKSFKTRALNYYTVQSFKGLESKIVFYIDVDGFKKIDDRRMNYASPEHPIHTSYVNYSKMVNDFSHDVYAFSKAHPEMELNNYIGVLQAHNLTMASFSQSETDLSALDGQCVMALIMCAVRSERFCDGSLLGYFRNGTIEKCLKRLMQIDG